MKWIIDLQLEIDEVELEGNLDNWPAYWEDKRDVVAALGWQFADGLEQACCPRVSASVTRVNS